MTSLLSWTKEVLGLTQDRQQNTDPSPSLLTVLHSIVNKILIRTTTPIAQHAYPLPLLLLRADFNSKMFWHHLFNPLLARAINLIRFAALALGRKVRHTEFSLHAGLDLRKRVGACMRTFVRKKLQY